MRFAAQLCSLLLIPRTAPILRCIYPTTVVSTPAISGGRAKRHHRAVGHRRLPASASSLSRLIVQHGVGSARSLYQVPSQQASSQVAHTGSSLSSVQGSGSQIGRLSRTSRPALCLWWRFCWMGNLGKTGSSPSDTSDAVSNLAFLNRPREVELTADRNRKKTKFPAFADDLSWRSPGTRSVGAHPRMCLSPRFPRAGDETTGGQHPCLRNSRAAAPNTR